MYGLEKVEHSPRKIPESDTFDLEFDLIEDDETVDI